MTTDYSPVITIPGDPNVFFSTLDENSVSVVEKLKTPPVGRVKPYYEEPGITIYCGDMREIMPALGSFDLLCCDPPYGIREAAGKNKSRTGGFKGKDGKRGKPVEAKDYGVADWDNVTPEPWVFGMMRAKTTHQIIFGGNYFPLPPSKCWLVWDKLNSGDFADCELAWTNLDKAVRKFEWMWNGMLQQDMKHKEYRVHPTQKPVAVMSWAISQAPDAVKTLIDPFGGSGSTIIAAKKLGISAVMIEGEEQYCEDAVERLRQSVLPLDVSE